MNSGLTEQICNKAARFLERYNEGEKGADNDLSHQGQGPTPQRNP